MIAVMGEGKSIGNTFNIQPVNLTSSKDSARVRCIPAPDVQHISVAARTAWGSGTQWRQTTGCEVRLNSSKQQS